MIKFIIKLWRELTYIDRQIRKVIIIIAHVLIIGSVSIFAIMIFVYCVSVGTDPDFDAKYGTESGLEMLVKDVTTLLNDKEFQKNSRTIQKEIVKSSERGINLYLKGSQKRMKIINDCARKIDKKLSDLNPPK